MLHSLPGAVPEDQPAHVASVRGGRPVPGGGRLGGSGADLGAAARRDRAARRRRHAAVVARRRPQSESAVGGFGGGSGTISAGPRSALYSTIAIWIAAATGI